MPKRDEEYMQGQRDMIARAALECMLEKGFEATTLRDVANQAGISMGTLYAHFKTRDELVQAAGSLDPVIEFEAVDNWADYEHRLWLSIEALETNERFRRTVAVSYEFLADLIRVDRAVPAIDVRLDQVYEFFRTSLQAMQARGEISLPLGIDATVQAHIQLQLGATYAILGDRRLDLEEVRGGFLRTIALTAGGIGDPNVGIANERVSTAADNATLPHSRIDDRITLGFPHIGALSIRKIRQRDVRPGRKRA